MDLIGWSAGEARREEIHPWAMGHGMVWTLEPREEEGVEETSLSLDPLLSAASISACPVAAQMQRPRESEAKLHGYQAIRQSNQSMPSPYKNNHPFRGGVQLACILWLV